MNRFFHLNLQFFAQKKGVGSSSNGRDSNSKRLGIKKYDGEFAKSGSIIFRQRGTKIRPGQNVGIGKDYTLFAKMNGLVRYYAKNNKSFVEVIEKKTDNSVII